MLVIHFILLPCVSDSAGTEGGRRTCRCNNLAAELSAREPFPTVPSKALASPTQNASNIDLANIYFSFRISNWIKITHILPEHDGLWNAYNKVCRKEGAVIRAKPLLDVSSQEREKSSLLKDPHLEFIHFSPQDSFFLRLAS